MIMISKKNRPIFFPCFISTWLFCSLMSTDYFLQVDGRVLSVAGLLTLNHVSSLFLASYFSLGAAQCQWRLMGKMEVRVPLGFLHITFAPPPRRTTLCVVGSVTSDTPFQRRHSLLLQLYQLSPHCNKTLKAIINATRKASLHSPKAFRPWSGPLVFGPVTRQQSMLEKICKKNFSPHGD